MLGAWRMRGWGAGGGKEERAAGAGGSGDAALRWPAAPATAVAECGQTERGLNLADIKWVGWVIDWLQAAWISGSDTCDTAFPILLQAQRSSYVLQD